MPLLGSSMSPIQMDSVGQTCTQAGSSPWSMRWAQKLHFAAVLVFASM